MPAGPEAFFAGRGHLRVLKHLEQAIAQDDRLMVLSGDDGVGKTTVVQRLLRGLDHRTAVWCVLLSATQLDTGELPGSLARAFGAPSDAGSPAQRHAGLRRHLSLLGRGRTVLAVVEDAHALPPEAIAELGEMIAEGPLRVLLVGRPGLRMLLQRQLALHPASLECHLEPLLDTETAAYLAWRLERVAGRSAPAFSDDATALIHRFSRGVPMRIDRLCERLLRAARQRGLRTVGAEDVQRIARPRLDDASIPMLTSAVDDEPPPSSGWHATTAPAAPAQDELPAWAVAAAVAPKRAGATATRRRTGLVLAALVLASVLGVAAWRHFEPLRVDSSMTASPPTVPRSPSPTAPAPAPPDTTLAEPAPAARVPVPMSAQAPKPAPPPATPPAAPPRASAGTPIAPPAPVPGACTAAVVALGLCTQNGNPP